MAEYPKWPEMPDEQKFEYLRECAENLSRTVQRIEENSNFFTSVFGGSKPQSFRCNLLETARSFASLRP